MNIFERTGKMALGSRLRFMAANITDEASAIYQLYNVDFSPKWFPVFFVLSEGGTKTITEIAQEIGHSQPSVTKLIREMRKAGLVEDKLEATDKRKNVAGLTDKGKSIAEKMIKEQCADIDKAIDGIIDEARHNLWEALAEWELLLKQKSLLKRVQEQKKLRECKDVQIIEYSFRYQAAFKALNEEWISTYFELEEADQTALNNPEEYILKKGGKIFVALSNNEPVGVCAIMKMDDPDYDFELAKMAVSPKVQGRSIGWLLAQAAIRAARESGAKKIYLESNTILKPAIHLYYKLGFQKITGHSTPYKRCNIQMELKLTNQNNS
ncbi:bifunctional helix-turn-helix transcriptional regulator/GNAT family N-acetyltransferase [Gynurincola endophyticus]|uniref:bifunctional helix-turn-helix transcriptional regulator/GNAT family N-acetyltransferase n=1 Tax=Gynurincola endophyticus TaxID=2479004 RepID=UPI000F8CBB05|nr:helix-turn-helix domain-containing GNAT family N-acetyltransferase [Gynurincola endophyticus]